MHEDMVLTVVSMCFIICWKQGGSDAAELVRYLFQDPRTFLQAVRSIALQLRASPRITFLVKGTFFFCSRLYPSPSKGFWHSFINCLMWAWDFRFPCLCLKCIWRVFQAGNVISDRPRPLLSLTTIQSLSSVSFSPHPYSSCSWGTTPTVQISDLASVSWRTCPVAVYQNRSLEQTLKRELWGRSQAGRWWWGPISGGDKQSTGNRGKRNTEPL